MGSPVWTLQRCSRSYTEKRRERKEREVDRRIKGGIKTRETNPASNQFPKCSPQRGTHKFTKLGREEKGEGGDRGDLVERKESPKRECSQASNLPPK